MPDLDHQTAVMRMALARLRVGTALSAVYVYKPYHRRLALLPAEFAIYHIVAP